MFKLLFFYIKLQKGQQIQVVHMTCALYSLKPYKSFGVVTRLKLHLYWLKILPSAIDPKSSSHSFYFYVKLSFKLLFLLLLTIFIAVVLLLSHTVILLMYLDLKLKLLRPREACSTAEAPVYTHTHTHAAAYHYIVVVKCKQGQWFLASQRRKLKGKCQRVSSLFVIVHFIYLGFLVNLNLLTWDCAPKNIP